MIEITKDTIIGDILDVAPQTAPIFLSIGMHCLGCPSSRGETVEEACVFFANIPKIARKLQTLQEVGLGYIQLGQAATTHSGGEAQRVKLANELARRDTGQTVYILDEPTTGLHVADVHRLV